MLGAVSFSVQQGEGQEKYSVMLSKIQFKLPEVFGSVMQTISLINRVDNSPIKDTQNQNFSTSKIIAFLRTKVHTDETTHSLSLYHNK